MRKTWAPAAILAAAVMVVIAVAGVVATRAGAPGVGVNQGTAVLIARDFYLHAHGDGVTVTNVVVRDTTAATGRDGNAVWRVTIDGLVTESSGVGYVSAMILDVDRATGAVTIWAQG